MEDKIITLATFPNITEASIVQGRLADAGIESIVIDAQLPLEDAFPGPSYGGVKLNIKETDVLSATEILNTVPQNISEQGEI